MFLNLDDRWHLEAQAKDLLSGITFWLSFLKGKINLFT